MKGVLHRHFTQELLKALASGKDFYFEDTVKKIVRPRVKSAVNEVMRAEITAVLGYPKSAQGAAAELGNSRNGYDRRTIATEYGAINVLVPRDRNGDFVTALFRPYQRRIDDIGYSMSSSSLDFSFAPDHEICRSDEKWGLFLPCFLICLAVGASEGEWEDRQVNLPHP